MVGPPGLAERLPEAMECLFPGSAAVPRRFAVEIAELRPGSAVTVAGVHAAAWAADHPSGAPALALRLTLGATVIAYTGDTAWTGTLTEVAAGADLLIAEAYYRDKRVPFHLSLADLAAHRAELTSRRIVLTHMSADMLGHRGSGRLRDRRGRPRAAGLDPGRTAQACRPIPGACSARLAGRCGCGRELSDRACDRKPRRPGRRPVTPAARTISATLPRSPCSRCC